MISIKNLSKSFGNRTLFDGFDFEMPDHGIVSIVGHSGSGKTTLLNMLAGLDFNYLGSVNVDGTNLTKLNENELANFRISNVGYVFQNFNLFNLESVFTNVMLSVDAVSRAPKRIKIRRVDEILNKLGILNLKRKKVNKLSGGEKQRVAIARAVVNKPKIILCDEPTGALDEANSSQIFAILRSISQSTLVVIASHDLDSVRKISDYILEIKEQKVHVLHNNLVDSNKEKFTLVGGTKLSKPALPISFKLKHAINKNKSKKWRSLVMNLMLSLSLTGVGLSIIVTDSVSKKVNTAFEEILNGNQIVMTSKNSTANTFNNYYTASEEVINKIANKYSDEIAGIGANYLVNYEDFFKDRNEFSIFSGNRNYLLNSISTRNINDFEWFESDLSTIYYPFEPVSLENDQVILALTYQDMSNICYSLQIQRNYTSLGHYINENNVFLVLNVENSYWQYDDEQIVEIIAVKEASKTHLCHSNSLWNQYVFEEMMRLPSDDNDDHEFPWEMYKIYFLKTINDTSALLSKVLYDEEFDDYIFEKTNFSYNPTLCEQNESCGEKRIFVYSADKNFVSPSIVEKIKVIDPNIIDYYFTSQFGYASYASNLFSGFSKNVFAALDENLLDYAIDADTSYANESNIKLNLPNGVIQGNYLNSLDNGLRFSAKYKSVITGRLPSNINEIAISYGLSQTLGLNENCVGKYLLFAGETNETNIDNRIKKEYGKTKLLIVGILDETKNYIYHNHDWSISFFRDKLGVSNFLLIPTGVVFEFDSNVNTTKLSEKLSKLFKQYNFECPVAVLNENITDTLQYANTILISFSILSILISVLLLATIILLSVIESKNEIKLFHYIGFNKKDINSTFVYQGLSQGMLSYFFSAFEIICVDQIISYFLGDYLKIGFSFSINFKPLIVTFFIALILPIFISKIMTLFLTKNINLAKKL